MATPDQNRNGRVVVVTGAGGSGCGRAIALRFAAGSASIVVCDVNEAGGHETVGVIEARGGRAAFVRADVRREPETKDLVAFAEATFGGLDVLINNASVHETSQGLDQWSGPLETDLLGAVHVTRWAIEAMRRRGGGSIVNIASISALWHGRTTPGGFPGYDVAKAGLIRMTTGLAPLAATDGIRVNCLAPGWIATDGPRQYWESLSPPERAACGVPERLLTPDEVAAAVQRLADDPSLAGRVLVWWSDERPRLIAWGDRGYRDAQAEEPLTWAQPAPDDGLSCELSATYAVARNRVFQALTNADVLQQVWSVQKVTVDARVGGETHAVYFDGGVDWSFTLTYTDIVPNDTLRWLVRFARYPTKEVRAAVRLVDTSAGTTLRLRMENFDTARDRDANRQAWERALAMLEDLL